MSDVIADEDEAGLFLLTYNIIGSDAIRMIIVTGQRAAERRRTAAERASSGTGHRRSGGFQAVSGGVCFCGSARAWRAFSRVVQVDGTKGYTVAI